MSQGENVHVVFGASGGAGSALVRELVGRRVAVRAVSHSGRGDFPAGVEVVRGDALDAASARAAARGAAVVYHCVNVPYPEWPEKLPRILENLIAAAADADSRLVYADNLYMYGSPGRPMTEELPPRPNSRKGALRARLAETLLAAHRDGRVRATIGRAADFYGPGPLNAVAGARIFDAVLAGKRAMWLGTLDAAHSLTFTEDFARVLATLGEREEALGEVWHVPDAGALTGRQFLEMVFDEAGAPAKIGVYGRTAVRFVGLFSRGMREFVEMLYQFEEPFILDGSKYTRTFGEAATPHREGIRRALEWYRGRQR